MIFTILSIGLALFQFFGKETFLPLPALFLSSMLFSLATIYYLFSFSLIQKMEKNSVSGVVALFRKETLIQGAFFYFSLLLLFSLFLINPLLFAIWISLFGIGIDLLLLLLRLLPCYLDPFSLIDRFVKEAQAAAKAEAYNPLCSLIDRVSEMAFRSLGRGALSLASQSIEGLQQIASSFLSFFKQESSQMTQYVLFFLFQRMEELNQRAAKEKKEGICMTIASSLGKTALEASKKEFSLATIPLSFLGKCGELAFQELGEDVGIKLSCIHLESARALIQQSNSLTIDLQTPLLTLLSHLETLTQKMFQKNKSIDLKILTKPFHDLKEILNRPEIAEHSDLSVILQNIERILGEYASLEVALRTIPSIQKKD